MTLSIRFLALTGHPVLYANGRGYPVASGIATVPYTDAVAISRDQAVPLMLIGTTAERPTHDPDRVNWPPNVMYDTTLSAPIFRVPDSNPTTWVIIDGTAA